MSNAVRTARQRASARRSAAGKDPIDFKMLSVEPPPGRSTVWSGQAVFGKCTYEWFYQIDKDHFWARAEMPVNSGFWRKVKTSPAFKVQVVLSLQNAMSSGREA